MTRILIPGSSRWVVEAEALRIIVKGTRYVSLEAVNSLDFMIRDSDLSEWKLYESVDLLIEIAKSDKVYPLVALEALRAYLRKVKLKNSSVINSLKTIDLNSLARMIINNDALDLIRKICYITYRACFLDHHTNIHISDNHQQSEPIPCPEDVDSKLLESTYLSTRIPVEEGSSNSPINSSASATPPSSLVSLLMQLCCRFRNRFFS